MRPALDDEVDAHLGCARIELRATLAALGGISDGSDPIERSTDRLALLVERARTAIAEDAHDEARDGLGAPIEDESSRADGQVASERSMQEIA
jgi:hypothetical protein